MKKTIISSLIVLGICIFGAFIATIINNIKEDDKKPTVDIGSKAYSYECENCGYNGVYFGLKNNATCEKCNQPLINIKSFDIGYYHISAKGHCILYRYDADGKWYRYYNLSYYDPDTKTLKDNWENGWSEYYGEFTLDQVKDRYLGLNVDVLEFLNDESHYWENERNLK